MVAYVPEKKTYVFDMTNQQDFIVKAMQGAVSATIPGHKVFVGYSCWHGCFEWVLFLPSSLLGLVKSTKFRYPLPEQGQTILCYYTLQRNIAWASNPYSTRTS